MEWKGDFDLADNKGRAKIAKAVLGFANREPRKAERTFEGCAYLLVGVSPGQLTSVTPVDVAQLEAGVSVYAGGDLDWRADYAEVDGSTVLVVTVEAPRPGDPIHPVKKAFQPDMSAGPSSCATARRLTPRHPTTTGC